MNTSSVSYIRKSIIGDRDFVIAEINDKYMVKLVGSNNINFGNCNVKLSKWFTKNNNIGEFKINVDFDLSSVFCIDQLFISKRSSFYRRCSNMLFRISYSEKEILLRDESGVTICVEEINPNLLKEMKDKKVMYALVKNLNHRNDILDVVSIEYFRTDRDWKKNILKDTEDLLRKPCIIKTKTNVYRNFIIIDNRVIVSPFNNKHNDEIGSGMQQSLGRKVKNISGKSMKKYEEIEYNTNGFLYDNVLFVEKTTYYERDHYEYGEYMTSIFDLEFIVNEEMIGLYNMYQSYMDSLDRDSFFNNQVYVCINNDDRKDEVIYKLRSVMPEININIVDGLRENVSVIMIKYNLS